MSGYFVVMGNTEAPFFEGSVIPCVDLDYDHDLEECGGIRIHRTKKEAFDWVKNNENVPAGTYFQVYKWIPRYKS